MGLTDDQVLVELQKLPASVRRQVFYDWRRKGRPQQQTPPGLWRFWICLPGRGWGKTATGGHTVKEWELAGAGRIALVGATAADTRDVMVTGETGILAAYARHERPWYRKSLRSVDFYKTGGGKAFLYSAEEPERLRGPQHHKGWLDELAAWDKPEAAFIQLKLGLRLGSHPQALITTTPKSIQIVKDLLLQAQDLTGRIVVTRGSTFDNAMNLPDDFLEEMIRSFGGTRLGRQELEGEVLEEEDALFKAQWIHHCDEHTPAPAMKRVIVAIDPAITTTAKSDETGIVVVGLGVDGRGYVLADRSGKFTPDEWARRTITARDDFKASLIIGETNRGGDMIEHTLKTVDRFVRFQDTRALKSKPKRAEPVAALYEQKRISHVDKFSKLEDQMVSWNPNEDPDSPDRIDAMVWGFTELLCQDGAPKLRGDLPKLRVRRI